MGAGKCSCGQFIQEKQLLDADDNILQVTLTCKPCQKITQSSTYQKALNKFHIKYGEAAAIKDGGEND